ncbi:MAG: hypothetical protein U0165_12100 [Polyangiaceae bacterium]
MNPFTDRLRFTLAVFLEAGTVNFTSGAFETLELDMDVYGFSGSVQVYVSTEQEADPLFDAFVSDSLLKVTLTVTGCLLDGTDQENVPISINALVVEKWMYEEVSDDLAGSPVVGRSYRMKLADAAKALWTHHHPTELKSSATVGAFLQQYTPAGITLTLDWPKLTEEQEIVCVATEPGVVSFYDWLIWYIDRYGGVLELDASASTYRIGEKKTRPSRPNPLEKEHVHSIEVVRPEPPRHVSHVLNAYSEGATNEALTNDLVIGSARRDFVVITPLTSEVDRRKKIEADKLFTPGDELIVDFLRFPPLLYLPGSFYELDEEFSKKLHTTGKKFRLVELHIRATADEGDEVPELDDETGPFDASIWMRLEHASSLSRRLPTYRPPRYPVVVEGKIVSEGGQTEDRTWMTLAGANDSITRYSVDIPLWNCKIVAPFKPVDFPGHLFFPAYKAERVLVELGFESAEISAFLDWAANARTPMDLQGNRIAFGHRDVDGTILDHSYVNNQPVLTLARTFGNDLQKIEVKEGTIFIEVKEDTTAQELQPTYDVTIVVTASKERVNGEVRGAIGELTGSFESSFGGAMDALEGAIGELDGALTSAEVQLVGKLEQVDVALQDIAAGINAITAEISDAVSQAKAALLAALS